MKNGFSKWPIIIIGAVLIAIIMVWGMRMSGVKMGEITTENLPDESRQLVVTPTAVPTQMPVYEEDLEKELRETETGEIEVVIEGLEQL